MGGVAFAATMMLLIGSFHAIAGLVAIFDDNFYVVARNYTFEIDTTFWGFVQLILGVGVAATGWALFSGKEWAFVTAIMLAGLSAVANFFFIPFYPFWAIVVIAIDVWVIWSLTRPGTGRA